ncbi:PAS domain-containing protein [Methylomagnum sp.]
MGTGQASLQRVHPDDRPGFLARRAGLTPDAGSYHTEYRLIRGDGREAVLVESARGFFDAGGKLQRLVGATTDITETKLAAEALRESEARFRTLFEASADAFMLLNGEGLIDCNDAALRILGYDNDSFIFEPQGLSAHFQRS